MPSMAYITFLVDEDLASQKHSQMDIISHGIPPEIASLIFQFCGSQSPLVVGAVCKSWRAIAWTTPQLWTSVLTVVDMSSLPTTFAAHTEFVKAWLSRSGQLPLDIRLTCRGILYNTHIDYSPLHPLIDLFNSYASRWRHLFLDIPSSLFIRFLGHPGLVSNLEVLKLNVLDDVRSSNPRFDLINAIPHPRSLLAVNLPLQSINIDWHGVTELEITTGSIVDVMHILPHASQLTHCKFDRLFFPDDDASLPTEPITLPHLRVLTFVSYSNVTSYFLSLMTPPCLEDLAIAFRPRLWALPEDVLIPLLTRSECPLQSLRLEGALMEEESFDRILFSLPSSLRHLSIASHHTDMYPALTDAVLYGMTDACCMESLESFEYEGTLTFEWSSLLRLFSPAQQDQKMGDTSQSPADEVTCAHARRLRTLKIRLLDYEVSPIDRDALVQFVHLRNGDEDGMKVKVNINVQHLRAAQGREDLLRASMREHGV